MQTILGANGQIGRELASSLARDFTKAVRLVSRHPAKVSPTDQLVAADLMDAAQTRQAVAGSEVVYMTAGLPLDGKLWQAQWTTMVSNAIAACETENAKLVYFDNTYMYPQTAEPQHEATPFQPHGLKGRVRAQATQLVLAAMAAGRINALIGRAPEFYGPGKTQSYINASVIAPLLAGKKARVFLRDDILRSLIYTPDASRAIALLGNTPDAYGQTWHLPCDDNRLTYKQFVELAADTFGVKADYKVIHRWQFWLAARVNKTLREVEELLPRYAVDNLFVSDKFKQRFPAFGVTPFCDGLAAIHNEHSRQT